MYLRIGRLLCLAALCAACTVDDSTPPARSGHAQPNILLVVVDDMGFSDLGSFGGEIPTPNLDRLAYAGIRFSNFHTAPMCSPSRAMLFTGVDPHLSGFGNMLEELSPNQRGRPGYEGYLNDRVVTVATLLRDAGYRTYATGKWHLGTNETARPSARGFDRSFVLDSGGASHFRDMRPAYAPSPDIKANYWEGDRRLDELPQDFDYSTQFFVDRLIDYLERDAESDRPFFASLMFTAPHWPLQAPEEAIERHRGRYDDGYDKLAERRLQQSIALGVLPENAAPSARAPKGVPWTELGDAQRQMEIRAMEVYAAMMDEVDRHAGRLFDYLERRALFNSTVIVFLSDNGPEGHDLDETWPMDAFPDIRETIDTSHDFSFEAMGREGSYVLYGPNWANAGSPAFRLHKGFPTEGGTRVAAFIHDPSAAGAASIDAGFASILDITPTILELAGIEHPGARYGERTISEPDGVSLVPRLRGGPGDSDTNARVYSVELLGKRAVRVGHWKLVHMPSPWGSGGWQLYNLEIDIAESNDLAPAMPEKVDEMLRYWSEYADEYNIILPDWVSGY